MRVFIDSNILISAARSPNSTPFFAFRKAITFPNCGVICDQNIDEIRRIFKRKFPKQITFLENFFAETLPLLQIVSVPVNAFDDENKIRDIDDRPILRAAIQAKADIIITGDKDFLESGIPHPKIMTAAQFVQSV